MRMVDQTVSKGNRVWEAIGNVGIACEREILEINGEYAKIIEPAAITPEFSNTVLLSTLYPTKEEALNAIDEEIAKYKAFLTGNTPTETMNNCLKYLWIDRNVEDPSYVKETACEQVIESLGFSIHSNQDK